MIIESYFLDLLCIVTGIMMAPWLSSSLVYHISHILKKIYHKHNTHHDDNVLYSCWGGTLYGNLVYSSLTLFALVMCEMSFFHREPKLFYFCLISLLFITLLCWNSITRIEITIAGLSIYKMVFGAETELYSLKNDDIDSIHQQLSVGNLAQQNSFFLVSGGFMHWIVIKLKKGEEILFPLPNKEDADLLFEFLEHKQLLNPIPEIDINESNN